MVLGESREWDLVVLGSVRLRYSSVGSGDGAGGDVEDDTLVMVGRPPGGRNCGC